MTPIAANTALVGVDVDLDYWPQGMHVLCEEPALVLCATGAGGGSQQAIFRSDLDPLLPAAWSAGHRTERRAALRPGRGHAWAAKLDHRAADRGQRMLCAGERGSGPLVPAARDALSLTGLGRPDGPMPVAPSRPP